MQHAAAAADRAAERRRLIERAYYAIPAEHRYHAAELEWLAEPFVKREPRWHVASRRESHVRRPGHRRAAESRAGPDDPAPACNSRRRRWFR